MKMKRVIATVLAGTFLFSVPVYASSPTSSGSSAIEEVAEANGTSVAAAEAQVSAGTYTSVADAIYHGNITVPEDIATSGGTDTWQPVQAESNAYVDGKLVEIRASETPVRIDQAVSTSANSHAAANGNAVINKGSISLQSFFDRYPNSAVTYPLLINGGQYNYREGDVFLLYNYVTGRWVAFPTTGFRKGHYDIAFPAGTDRSAYLNKQGKLSYLIEGKK